MAEETVEQLLESAREIARARQKLMREKKENYFLQIDEYNEQIGTIIEKIASVCPCYIQRAKEMVSEAMMKVISVPQGGEEGC